ncbi:MAG: alpha/beta hydrolase [Citrobacter freundii]|nr:MAG: alpha/beta hydrolase [Citrobacter freundii]
MKSKNTKAVIIAALTGIVLLTACESKTESTPGSKTESSANAPTARAEYIEVAPNVRLHVTDWGEGQPVVLIHGYPLSDASWEYQYHPLLKAGYRVIGITLRGFGQSDKPYGKYNYDQFADDIKAVLDKLDIKDAVLGGHSMGGAISLHYTAKYNAAHLSKLVLFSAAAPVHTKRPDFDYPLFTKEAITRWVELNNNNRPALYDELGAKFISLPTTLTPGIGAWLGAIEMQASPYATEQALIALRDEDLRSDLPKINIPTLIMHARKDSIVSFALAEQLNKGIKNSTLVPFEKSGHAAFLEEKDKTNDELIRFIRQ